MTKLLYTLALLYIISCISCSNVTSLKTYNIDLEHISVSGLSAGAYFATQFAVAYSSKLRGSGSLAGGPYYCAQGSLLTATNACMFAPSMINVAQLVAKTKEFASSQRIDSIKHLQKHKIYVFHGTIDSTVRQDASRKMIEVYKQLGASCENIKERLDVAAAHAQPTDDYGNPCQHSGSPWINKCGFSGAGELLEHIHGPLNPPTSPIQSNLKRFSQSDFIRGQGFASSGFIYVPSSCEKGAKCKLHFVFHGCQQNYDTIGTIFVEHAGYNKFAESNDIIVVYPQTVKTVFSPVNPQGCFDWWGYTNSQYAWKTGPQMSAIAKMISKLTGYQFE